MPVSLVTGGAGFIGSHLCKYLLDKEHKVFCYDNLITGKIENIEPFKNNGNFIFRELDVSKEIPFDGNLDYIFHLASLASPVFYYKYQIETLEVGSCGIHNVLKLAKEKKARMLFSSTSEVYGDPMITPQNEEYWGNVNPIGTRSMYDESKRYAEAYTMAYNRTYQVETRIARG